MVAPAAVPGVDPSGVSNPDELAACLDGLRRRRGLSYEAMENAAAKLQSRSGGPQREPLPKTTVGEIVTGKRLPAKGKLLTFLTVCEVAPADLAQWLAAWERASTAALARPAGAVRVRDARPRLLGVHAAINVPGVSDDALPEYVPRDIDADEFGVRTKVNEAAQQGGFVLLVGGSSVGKTRCAFEAVKTLLPDWWLVHPAGPADVTALAAAPTARTVVWLDELQRYLDGEHGLTGGIMRALLNAPHRMVIIGTVWPDRYTTYTAMPGPGGGDLRAREREVLNLAAVIRIASEFSAAEQDRVRAAAFRDRRLAVALESAGYGLTQTLAAAPQLVAHWEDAKTGDPYAWAVLTAALDAVRLGARAPLSTDLLRAATPGYCTVQQRAEAPVNWFEQALAYVTARLHGAAAALAPAGTGMGQVAGYTPADYLIQHASRERRTARVPTSTWDALLGHIRDPDDAARLAGSAVGRLLYCYALPLYRHAGDGTGDRTAAMLLADLLARRGDLDELRTRADAGDRDAAIKLADLLARRGDLDELQARADAGDEFAATRLAGLLADSGHMDELRTRADAGDEFAATRLAGLLADSGHMDELRTRADAGDEFAATRLAELLDRCGDLDELCARTEAGDEFAATRLAGLLADSGHMDALCARADAGNKFAIRRLGRLLYDHGYLDALRALADADDVYAAHLAALLANRGHMDELCARADADDPFAVVVLVGNLCDRGDLDELRTRADAGDRRVNRAAAMELARLLYDRGDLDELRTRADAGDLFAATGLARLLADRGDLDEAARILFALAAAGKGDGEQLAQLLDRQGRGEEAQRLRQFGLNPDGSVARGLSEVIAHYLW